LAFVIIFSIKLSSWNFSYVVGVVIWARNNVVMIWLHMPLGANHISNTFIYLPIVYMGRDYQEKMMELGEKQIHWEEEYCHFTAHNVTK